MPRIEFEPKFDFKDVLIIPKRSNLKSRSDVELEREYKFKHSKKHYKGIPIMASNMDTIGNFKVANEMYKHSMFTVISKQVTVEEWYNILTHDDTIITKIDHIAVSSGVNDDDLIKLDTIVAINNDLHYICLDVANGYTESFVNTVKKVREKYPTKTIIAGNVVTIEMVEELILAGADIVKIGIGSGSVCTTRLKTGVGYPQLSAIIECADAAHGLGGHIIADGGCTCTGDIAKAFGAGADFVMIGGMLAGCDETSNVFYGMASEFAMNKYNINKENKTSEGKVVNVPYKGKLETILYDILGGLRSTCTYVGASKLKELSKRTTFVIVTQQTNNIFN